jgi:hypothetical protein
MTWDGRSYDVIGFGDEVPGVLAVISAAREYRRKTRQYPRVLLMSKGNLQEGIGGHLVRGGLAYLDRSQVDRDTRQKHGLETFGDPPALYKEFLQKAGVTDIALDPRKANEALKVMLREAGVDLLSKVEIAGVNKTGTRISNLVTSRGTAYFGKYFIDATVNAELAQKAGVPKMLGFGTFGLPESELPVTLTFETQGLSVKRLKDFDYAYLKRFTNITDSVAQQWLLQASGGDPKLADQLRKEMIDPQGNLKTFWSSIDHIDVRSPALSVAYHAFRGTPFSFQKTGIILDEANIAVLPNERLSWNALLFAVTGTEAEELARNAGKPTPRMQQEMAYVIQWLKNLGATSVTPASELYIRHAGNILGAVQPLTGAQMLLGGVPAAEALGSFGYYFDVRGGIPKLGDQAKSQGWYSSLSFPKPLFNIGMQHALIKNVPNLAVVSPASGFEGFASSAGRIVEFNAAVGQAVGIAAIIALLNNKNLADISNFQVRQILNETGRTPKIYGQPNTVAGTLLAQFESRVTSDVVIA